MSKQVEIKAEIKNIKNILVNDENFYQIPDYQRPYSWDKENLSDLIDDLLSAFLDNSNEDYFCGSLVLVDNDNDKRFDIIDGQQRITTFTILSCIFRDVYFDSLGNKAKDFIKNSIQDQYEENKRKLKFLTDEQFQIDFEETVLKKIDFKDDISNIEKSFPNNKYLQNAYHLKNFLSEHLREHDISIDDFVLFFYEKIVLTVITCPSQDSAIQIFTVLNDRWMPLNPIDILKSKLMQQLDSKEDRNAFRSKWEHVNRDLNLSDLYMDNMLNTYLYYRKASNPKNRLDKELWDVFEKSWKNSLEIIQEIYNFSISYIEILKQEDKNIYCLRYLRHKIYWNSILVTAHFTDYSYIDDLKEILVAYYYQNWIAWATTARIKQTSFNILKYIKQKQSIQDIKGEIYKNLEDYNTTQSFKDAIVSENVYWKKWDRAVLLLVEYFLSDNNSQNYISVWKSLHVEHILPRTPQWEWLELFNDEEMSKWTNSLTNLTLLSMRKNIQASNSDFKLKKIAYWDSDNLVTSFLTTQKVIACDTWNTSQLEMREKFLNERIMDKLDIFTT